MTTPPRNNTAAKATNRPAATITTVNAAGGTAHLGAAPSAPLSEPLLTALEVADLLAVPESWVREATREGRIPHLALGRYRRYHRSAIEAWLTDQQAGPKPGNRR